MEKTKFILHGGTQKGNTDEYQIEFFNEIYKDTKSSLNILLIPFSKDLDRKESSTSNLRDIFELFKKDKILSFETADESSLISQIQHADILYFMSGVSLKLLETLKPFNNLKESLLGKVVVGESAGANVLSSYFYTPSADQISPGLGFVPVKTIPHYVDEYEHKLDSIGENIPLLKLKEYEFKVFER